MLKDYINDRLKEIDNLVEFKNELMMWSESKDEIDLNLVLEKFKRFEGEEENEVWLVLEEDLDDDEWEEISQMYKDYIFGIKIK